MALLDCWFSMFVVLFCTFGFSERFELLGFDGRWQHQRCLGLGIF
jgi:hypothetical protein